MANIKAQCFIQSALEMMDEQHEIKLTEALANKYGVAQVFDWGFEHDYTKLKASCMIFSLIFKSQTKFCLGGSE